MSGNLFPASTCCPRLLLSLNCTVSALASEFQFVTRVNSGLVLPSLLVFTSSFCNSLLWQVYTWLVCTITQGDNRPLFDLTCSVVQRWGGAHWKQTLLGYVDEGAYSRPRRGIASPVAIRRGEGAQRKRCRDPRCSPRGNPACRGTFGGPGVSREVPCSVLKWETVLGSLDATPKVPWNAGSGAIPGFPWL